MNIDCTLYDAAELRHPLIGQHVTVAEHRNAGYTVPAGEGVVTSWGSGWGRVLYLTGVEWHVWSHFVTFTDPKAAAAAVVRKADRGSDVTSGNGP